MLGGHYRIFYLSVCVSLTSAPVNKIKLLLFTKILAPLVLEKDDFQYSGDHSTRVSITAAISFRFTAYFLYILGISDQTRASRMLGR